MIQPRHVVSIALVLTGALPLGLKGYSLLNDGWSSNSVPYYINPTNTDVSEAAARTAVQAGADAWATQSNADFEFSYAGDTESQTISLDGENNVFFRDASSGSAIATAYYWSSGGEMIESDVVFWDGGFTFFTGTSGCSSGVYIEDVATHEFGHMAGVGHSSVSNATMYPYYSLCSSNSRTLASDDQEGIEALYPEAGDSPPPTSPSDLSASPSEGTPTSAIELTWTDNADDEDGHAIERSEDGANYLEITEVGADQTAYTDSDLFADTTYWYRIRAFGVGGYSEYANSASATTDAVDPKPGTPSNPNPSDGSTGVKGLKRNPKRVKLMWSEAAGAQQYDVYFGTSEIPPLYQSDVSRNRLKVNGLTSSPTYFWRIVAKNGNSETSGPTWQFTTEEASLPETPSSPRPSDGTSGVKKKVKLMWSKAAGAQQYDVYFGTSVSPPLHQSDVSRNRLRVNGLALSQTYFWRIVAKNSEGETSGSTWQFTTGEASLPETPSSPRPSDGTSGVKKKVKLMWSKAAGAQQYDVYFGTSVSPPLYQSDVSRNRLKVNGLASSQTHFWRIVAKNSEGETSGSTWQFTTKD